jgi:hypothetical protein
MQNAAKPNFDKLFYNFFMTFSGKGQGARVGA